MKLIDIQHDTN